MTESFICCKCKKQIYGPPPTNMTCEACDRSETTEAQRRCLHCNEVDAGVAFEITKDFKCVHCGRDVRPDPLSTPLEKAAEILNKKADELRDISKRFIDEDTVKHTRAMDASRIFLDIAKALRGEE